MGKQLIMTHIHISCYISVYSSQTCSILGTLFIVLTCCCKLTGGMTCNAGSIIIFFFIVLLLFEFFPLWIKEKWLQTHRVDKEMSSFSINQNVLWLWFFFIVVGTKEPSLSDDACFERSPALFGTVLSTGAFNFAALTQWCSSYSSPAEWIDISS